MAKVIAQDTEGPHEGPAIGMQLGRGHVTFVSNARSNPVSGKQSLTRLKMVEYMKKKRPPTGFVRSLAHTVSPFSQGRTDTYASCSLPKTRHFSSASPSLYVMTSWLEVYLEVSAKTSLEA